MIIQLCSFYNLCHSNATTCNATACIGHFEDITSTDKSFLLLPDDVFFPLSSQSCKNSNNTALIENGALLHSQINIKPYCPLQMTLLKSPDMVLSGETPTLCSVFVLQNASFVRIENFVIDTTACSRNFDTAYTQINSAIHIQGSFLKSGSKLTHLSFKGSVNSLAIHATPNYFERQFVFEDFVLDSIKTENGSRMSCLFLLVGGKITGNSGNRPCYFLKDPAGVSLFVPSNFLDLNEFLDFNVNKRLTQVDPPVCVKQVTINNNVMAIVSCSIIIILLLFALICTLRYIETHHSKPGAKLSLFKKDAQ